MSARSRPTQIPNDRNDELRDVVTTIVQTDLNTVAPMEEETHIMVVTAGDPNQDGNHDDGHDAKHDGVDNADKEPNDNGCYMHYVGMGAPAGWQVNGGRSQGKGRFEGNCWNGCQSGHPSRDLLGQVQGNDRHKAGSRSFGFRGGNQSYGFKRNDLTARGFQLR